MPEFTDHDANTLQAFGCKSGEQPLKQGTQNLDVFSTPPTSVETPKMSAIHTPTGHHARAIFTTIHPPP